MRETPGSAPSTRSSMLGEVAAVMEIVSPSQPRPAVSHTTWISSIGEEACADRLGKLMTKLWSPTSMLTCLSAPDHAHCSVETEMLTTRPLVIRRRLGTFCRWRQVVRYEGAMIDNSSS